MPKEVKITATRKKTGHPDIVFWRIFSWNAKPSFKKFIDDYAKDMKARLFRVAGSGDGIKVAIDEIN